MSRRHEKAMRRYGIHDTDDTVNLAGDGGWFMYEIGPIDWNYGAVELGHWLEEGGNKEFKARFAYFTRASVALGRSTLPVSGVDFEYSNRVFYLPDPEYMSMRTAFLFGWHSGIRYIVSPVRMLFERTPEESAWHPAMASARGLSSNAECVAFLLTKRGES